MHRLSLLMPNRPHVFIDNNPAICKEARRTNALVVEVNKRLGVVGLVDRVSMFRVLHLHLMIGVEPQGDLKIVPLLPVLVTWFPLFRL